MPQTCSRYALNACAQKKKKDGKWVLMSDYVLEYGVEETHRHQDT
jgi:hypothetical protein